MASRSIWTALLLWGLLIPGVDAYAASCCGGGASSSLILPKISEAMADISFNSEKYNGFWDGSGTHIPDPPGSDLRQHRLNLGYAKRLASRLQGGISVPYVMNVNDYSGSSYRTQGPGDSLLGLWYENFDDVTCTYKVNSISDLKPASYFGLALTVPTGISPYDDVEHSFNVTGRGFYRLDALVDLEKTVYPWNAVALFAYGKHLERPVNREYGRYVAPYRKNLGDRQSSSFSLGYTLNLPHMDTLTFTAAYNAVKEGAATVGGTVDAAGGISKKSVSLAAAWSPLDRSKILKVSWDHSFPSDGWGTNFPATDTLSIGASHVFR